MIEGEGDFCQEPQGNGKIKLMRQFLDIVASARAMLPNGLADIPAADEASS
jgi:hypothetical protein